MLYQNILTGISPYFAKVGYMGGFREHRHADIELHYCISGNFCATVNKKNYEVREGELILISPMAAHAFPETEPGHTRALSIIVGVSFLKNFFSYFSTAREDHYIIDLKADNELSRLLYLQVEETCRLCESELERRELLIRGNLCKICSYLIDCIVSPDDLEPSESREMTKVANIEKALEMIYYNFASPLTVDDAAAATGYGKSNFCKIFKSITGDTFHNVLNRQRVESACALLSETNFSISQIATQVGFGETKTFCRVFKSVISLTPGEYRKKHK